MPAVDYSPINRALLNLGEVGRTRNLMAQQQGQQQFQNAMSQENLGLSKRSADIAERGADIREKTFDLTSKQAGLNNQLTQSQLESAKQKQAIERIKIIGPIAKAGLDNPDMWPQIRNHVVSLFPEYEPKLSVDFQEALPLVDYTAKVYDVMTKKEAEPFTLSQGQQRFDEKGNVIASVAPKTEKPSSPLSAIGKLNQDLENNLITTDQYNSSIEKIKKETGAEKEITLDGGEIAYSGSKQLPAAKAELLSEGKQINLVTKPLNKLIEGWEFGPVSGKVRALNPYDADARKADSDIRRAAQVIGKFMEGGVLRKEDEEKYRKMLPNITDTKEVAKHKLDSIEKLLSDKYVSYIQDFGAAGYDVTGFAKKPSASKEPEMMTGHEVGAISQSAQDYLKSIGMTYGKN